VTKRLRDALTAQIEARQAVNAADEDDKRAEALAALTAADKEVREALDAEPETTTDDLATDGVDAEERERREIRERTNMGDYIRSAIVERPVEGAAAEWAAAMGCPGMMPLEAFDGHMAPRETRQARETRADAVSAGPALDTQTQTAMILPSVFRETIAADLGIEMPMVGTGLANYPVITTPPTAGARAVDAGGDATAAVITPISVAPKRIQGRVSWRREDAALLGDLDTALVGDLGAVLADVYDQEIVEADGDLAQKGGRMHGLSAQLPLPAAATDAAATTFPAFVQRVAALLDGTFSTMLSQLRLQTSVEAYAYLASLFRSNESETAALDWAMGRVGSLMASGRITQAARGAAAGARSVVYCRRARPVGRVAVAPVWQGVNLIRDEITGARQGHVAVNADMLVGGIAFTRPSAFAATSIATTAKQ
jgi:hypothetical protein